MERADTERRKYLESSKPNLPRLQYFKAVVPDHVEHLIKEAPSKSYQSDAIPTNLLKESLPVLTDIITAIVNKSTSDANMPEELKEALVKPLLKNANLDLVDKNYRLVSNLSFLSKLIKRVVGKQLLDHVEKNNLMEQNQSAYGQFHSTETTCIKVRDDILRGIDNKEVMCLVLLDLSATFNTIDDQNLLERLENHFGIEDLAPAWIRSYVSGQKQRVVIGDPNMDGTTSSRINLKCPWGICADYME